MQPPPPPAPPQKEIPVARPLAPPPPQPIAPAPPQAFAQTQAPQYPQAYPPGYPVVANPYAAAFQTAPSVGVGGWLLFLILCLTVFGPLIALFLEILTLLGGGILSGTSSAFVKCSLLQSLVIIPSAVWALFAGVGLYKLQPGAVRRAKLYLLLGGPPAAILFYSLPFLFLTAAQQGNISGVFTVMWVVIFVGINIAFHFYLRMSRRVAATYPQG
jgi:hypothetical protein